MFLSLQLFRACFVLKSQPFVEINVSYNDIILCFIQTGGAKKDSNIKQTAIVDNTQENHYVDAVSSITDTPSQPKSDSQTLDDLVSQDEAQSATTNRAQIVEITNPVFRSESVNKLPDLPYHLPYASLCHD